MNREMSIKNPKFSHILYLEHPINAIHGDRVDFHINLDVKMPEKYSIEITSVKILGIIKKGREK